MNSTPYAFMELRRTIYYSYLQLLSVIIFCSLYTLNANAQPACQPTGINNCGATALVPPPVPENHELIFDTFGKYINGITLSGATTLRLNVTGGGACRWKLHVNVDNNGAVGTSTWEEGTPYGTSGAVPTMNILEVRVRNECVTSLTGNAYTNILNNSQTINIIDNTFAPNADAGDPCPATNVNGAGDYLTNYNQYHFTVDYRVTPGLGWRPGNYNLYVRFCLTEDN